MSATAEEIPSIFALKSITNAGPTYEMYDDMLRTDRSEHWRRLDALQDSVERGVMPSASNGYSFVIDRRPPEQESIYIPPLEYTRYFSNWQIPISEPGHTLFRHDIGHVPSFQTMFSCAVFANTVQAAATHALTNPELCRTFTGAIDAFGDTMRSLEEGSMYRSMVVGARSSLERLLSILPADDNQAVSPQTLFYQIWTQLGLDKYEQYALAVPERIYSLGADYEYPEPTTYTTERYTGTDFLGGLASGTSLLAAYRAGLAAMRTRKQFAAYLPLDLNVNIELPDTASGEDRR